MPDREHVDVVIVGAGQAGISLSYFLQQRHIDHIVLERDRAFSAWHNRWDGFCTNTPNWMNTLPVIDDGGVPGNDPGGFATREEVVAYFEKCLQAVNPPIRTKTEVLKVKQLDGDRWEVHTRDVVYEARSVAICSGALSVPKIPQAAAEIPRSVKQIHACEYQNPEQITSKSVLLVGTGSSGVQICKLLAESRRFERLHLAVSNVMILPYSILGLQTHRFLHLLRIFDISMDSFLGKLLYSRLQSKGDPIMRPAPPDFEKEYGVELYGKFTGIDRSLLQFADGKSLETDDLTIIWCMGFRGDYAFIDTKDRAAAFDETGYPRHVRGVVDGAPGLYFVGLRYQHTVASHDIYGVGNDAKFISNRIAARRAAPETHDSNVISRPREVARSQI